MIENQPCSSLVCLNLAMKAIQGGKCDRAVVCGVDRFGQAVADGNNDNLRVSCVVVQKRVDCKRVYARIIDSKIGARSPTLIKNIYAEHEVNPGYVTYVENYCQDVSVLEADTQMLVHADRSLPLYIGSRLSQAHGMHQMTGMCAVVRMVIAIQRRVLPATPDMPLACFASKRGSASLAKENIKLAGGLMALNAVCENNSTIYFLLQPNNMNMTPKLGKFPNFLKFQSVLFTYFYFLINSQRVFVESTGPTYATSLHMHCQNPTGLRSYHEQSQGQSNGSVHPVAFSKCNL